MKFITNNIFILILILLLNARDSELLAKQKQNFQIWMSTNNGSISLISDYNYRLSVFIENRKEIEGHNRSKSSFKKKPNVFAHLSEEKCMSRYTSNQSIKKNIGKLQFFEEKMLFNCDFFAFLAVFTIFYMKMYAICNN